MISCSVYLPITRKADNHTANSKKIITNIWNTMRSTIGMIGFNKMKSEQNDILEY